MGSGVTRIGVVVLFVTDLDRTIGFYRDTLTLSMKYSDQNSAVFDLQGTTLLLLTEAGARDLLADEAVSVQPGAGANALLVSEVEDVDAVYADLTAKGVAFLREPVDRWWGLRTAHFRDPDGHVWEINQEVPQRSANQ